MGSSVPLSPMLCGAVRQLLQSNGQNPAWSRRAIEKVGELRGELSECCGEGSVIARRGISVEWWTFAGLAANQTVVQYLQPHIDVPLRADNLWINLPSEISLERLNQVIQRAQVNESAPDWNLWQPAADLLKFGELLPTHLLRDLILTRIADIPRARQILNSQISVIDIG